MKQQWRARRRLAFLPGLEIGRVRTTARRAGDVFGGGARLPAKKATEGLSSERRWKDKGVYCEQKKSLKGRRSQRGVGRVCTVQRCVEFTAPGKEGRPELQA